MRRLIALLAVLLLCVFVCVNVHAEETNLIPQGDSDMDLIQSWLTPYGGEITTVSLDNGANKCLCFTRKNTRSWESPGLDLFPYLWIDLTKNGSGEYALEFDFLVTNQENTVQEINFNCLMRATNKLTMTNSANNDSTEFRGSFGRIQGVKTNQWMHFSNTVSFYAEEIAGNSRWMMCFDGMPDELRSLYLDNVRLYRLKDASGGTVGKVRISAGYESKSEEKNPAIAGVAVETAEPRPDPNAEKELFSPRIGQTAIVTCGVTVALVAIGTAIRIRFRKKTI